MARRPGCTSWTPSWTHVLDAVARPVAGDRLLLGHVRLNVRRAIDAVRPLLLAVLPQQPHQPVLLRTRQRTVQEGVRAHSAPGLETRMNTAVYSVATTCSWYPAHERHMCYSFDTEEVTGDASLLNVTAYYINGHWPVGQSSFCCAMVR